MDPRFDAIFTSPENSIFKVVFFPDRIYHARYLNATRSERYRYNVHEVRSKADITVMKGQVYLDGTLLTSFLRIEYRASRLIEVARERGRLMGDDLIAWVCLHPNDPARRVEVERVRLHLCPWTDAYQVELWERLEPPDGMRHDLAILDQMGSDAPITRKRSFGPSLRDLGALRQIQIAFRESDRSFPSGRRIADPVWDNNYLRSYQAPNDPAPNSSRNTIETTNYQLDFQRGWHIDASQVAPVRYENALMEPGNPEIMPNNIVDMRWILQEELGGTLTFFHEVTLAPGRVEGTHQHIGSEELYYIVEGSGIAYIGENDDPTAEEPVVQRDVFGLGKKACREIQIGPRHVIYTKSGGVHGIRNTGQRDLRFVAFLYHSA